MPKFQDAYRGILLDITLKTPLYDVNHLALQATMCNQHDPDWERTQENCDCDFLLKYRIPTLWVFIMDSPHFLTVFLRHSDHFVTHTWRLGEPAFPTHTLIPLTLWSDSDTDVIFLEIACNSSIGLVLSWRTFLGITTMKFLWTILFFKRS